MGKNLSLSDKIFYWGQHILAGDFGTSLIYQAPVSQILWERFSLSFPLLFGAWLFTGIFSFILASLAALNEGKFIDKLIKFTCYTLSSLPSFWLGILLLSLFAVWIPLFPSCCAYPLSGEERLILRI
jgi:peptide/nickel transport system permease protein